MNRQPHIQPRHALDWTPPRRPAVWRRSAIAAVTAAVAVAGAVAASPASAAQPSVFLSTVDAWDTSTAAVEAAEDAAEQRAIQNAVTVMAEAEQARAERAAAQKAAAEEAAAVQSVDSALALANGSYTVGSPFGATGSWARYHTGIDFVAAQGTPVYSVIAGTVVETTSASWAGTHVAIQADDGSATLYAHLSGKEAAVGDRVEAGELIGYVGNTGRSFGAHLHLEYYAPGTTPGDVYSAQDPAAYLAGLGLNP